jgi:cysteinyl-tRNA synthetase
MKSADNELAQSEAYWTTGEETQWVNYFIHSGHLGSQSIVQMCVCVAD